ncbi:MAG: hypothetical protein WAK55_19090 [Xanthobacteraceae bacterium]
MAKLMIRIAGAFGVTALAAFFLGFLPLLGDPTAGAGVAAKRTPSFSVNRELKGDRLPISNVTPAAPRSGSNVERSDRPDQIPVGCEGSFSPISAPQFAHVFGRCMT